MRRPLLILILALAACATPSRVPEGVEWVAVRDLNEQFTDPDDPTNRPALVAHAPPGMIRRVDVSPDGKADWLIDYSTVEAPAWCGTGGCRMRLYVSTPEGLVRALDQQVLSLDVRPGVVEAGVHHLYCGDAVVDCARRLVWDPERRALIAAPPQEADWTPLDADE